MDPEVNEVVPVSDPAPQENTEPEQTPEVALPEGGEATKAEDKSPEQETIKKLQRRIDRLTAKNGGTARERDMLRDEITRLSSAQGEVSEKPASEQIEQIASQRAKEIVAEQSLNDKAASLLKAGKKIEGFQEALETLRDEVPFTDAKGKVTPFLEAVLDSDMPAKIIEYLGANPDEASDFAELSPAQIGRRLARLELKLEQDGKVTKSKAPAPISPISGSNGSKLVNLANSSMDDYIAQRRKQGARWR